VIIHDCADFWIIDKPPGMPSQPDKTGDESVLDRLGGYAAHRLDRGVGGLMAVAKNAQAAADLQEALRHGGKAYLAVCAGAASVQAELVNYLAKNQRQNISRVVAKNTPGAKHARLTYQRLAICQNNGQPLSLIRINLDTGRHHQIRAQLAHAGLPIWGDRKYAPRQYWPGNIALQSAELRFSYGGKNHHFALNCDNIAKIHPFDLFEVL